MRLKETLFNYCIDWTLISSPSDAGKKSTSGDGGGKGA